jgi:DNA primase
MGGLIPESFIEELLGRLDIVEVIERRVPLKRAGSEFQACCPFHEEKTPSFTVSPKKQFYHCFGCGAHGTAIGFLMQYEGLEFVDTVEELARSIGLEVPRDAGSAPRPEAGLHELMEAVSKWYQDQLKGADKAVDYLKGRGLSGEICRDFEIGYAPSSWDALIKRFGKDETRLKLLKRAGMLSEGNSGSYDKFRDRIMFPIHDRRGRVIAFGGRALDDNGPKYLNSPETELFHKGRELYGLYQARQRVGRLDTILVVEGYMDVAALAQFGFRNVVATLGTATTGDHAELLFRASETAVFCFDGDKAGRKAAWRALESTLPRLREGRLARFLFLPEGEDPDSMVRNKGAEHFAQLLDQAQPLSEFFFEHFSAQVDMHSIDGRARLVELARPLLQQLPEGIFRQMMFDRLEQLSQHRIQINKPVTRPGKIQRAGQQRTPMRLALAYLVQSPELGETVKGLDEFSGCDLPGIEIFLQLVDFCAVRPNISTAQLLEHYRDDPTQAHLLKLAIWQLPGESEMQALEFQDSVTSLRLQWIDSQLSALPRIVEQSPAERVLNQALMRRRLELRNRLQGNDETDGA